MMKVLSLIFFLNNITTIFSVVEKNVFFENQPKIVYEKIKRGCKKQLLFSNIRTKNLLVPRYVQYFSSSNVKKIGFEDRLQERLQINVTIQLNLSIVQQTSICKNIILQILIFVFRLLRFCILNNLSFIVFLFLSILLINRIFLWTFPHLHFI